MYKVQWVRGHREPTAYEPTKFFDGGGAERWCYEWRLAEPGCPYAGQVPRD